MMAYNYQAACKAAADAQGVTLIADVLRMAGYTVAIEQTGGFTMVAIVSHPRGTVAVTDDGYLGMTDYIIGAYPHDSWETGEGIWITGEGTQLDARFHNAPNAFLMVDRVRDALAWFDTLPETKPDDDDDDDATS